MGIDGPTFVLKCGYFLLIWVKVCPQKLAFSSFVSQFYESAGFFDKMLALLNKKCSLVLVSGFFSCCIFAILFKYYLKSHFLTKTAP